jgi:hypothetical protein
MGKEERIAEIQLVQGAVQPMLKVVVPRGTTLAETIRLQPTISEILGKLRGCLPCNSGVPIFFQEREEIERVVRVDLGTLRQVGG